METLALDLNETASALKEQLNGMEYDPREADQVERHLGEIHRLKGKYGSTIEEVIAYGDKAKDELQDVYKRQPSAGGLVRLSQTR